MTSTNLWRRAIGPVALATSFLLPVAVAQAAPAEHHADAAYFPAPVYVSLQKSGTIEKFPDQTVYPGFPGAHYLALSPDGKTLVVSGFKTGQVYIADAKTGKKRATLSIGKVVQGVKIDPQGNYALAVNASGGRVAVIDLAHAKVVQSIAVGHKPHNVRFSRDGRLAYVTVQGDDDLAVIDMATLKKVESIPVTGLDGPHNLDLSADGRRLWIRSHPAKATDTGHVAMMNLAQEKVVNSLAVGPFHGGVDLEPTGAYVLATDIGGHTVDVMDRNALTVITRITVGDGPHGVRMSDDGHWAYVTATRGNELDVIDMRNLKLVDRIETKGKFPFWLALDGNR
ncbi:YVTN beta-propeller repeat-containing protein [Salinisphaera hydrothermalis EPR70]